MKKQTYSNTMPNDTKESALSDFLALQMKRDNTRNFPSLSEKRRLALRSDLLGKWGMNEVDLMTCIREERNFNEQ